MGVWRWCAAWCLVGLGCGGVARGQDTGGENASLALGGGRGGAVEPAPWVFVADDELSVSGGVLEAIDDGRVVLRDAGGGAVEFGAGEWVCVYPADRLAQEGDGPGGLAVGGGRSGVHESRVARRLGLGGERLGMAVTTGGVWLPGRVVASNDGGKGALWWDHPRLGAVELSLDELRLVTFPGGPSARALDASVGEPLEDLMILANADRLGGFVESIGARVSFDGPDGVVDVDEGVVGAVVLANPSESRSGPFVWIDDGTVARYESLEVREGVVRFVVPGVATAGYAGSRWLAGCVSDASRLRGLASLDPVSQAGSGGRRVTQQIEVQEHPLDAGLSSGAALGVRDVRLPGPMEVTWELPAGASWFAATGMLEHASSAWADCELVVIVDGAEVAREHLDADRPVTGVRVGLEGARTLVVRVEAGANGPVQDQVVLHRPMVLLGEAGGAGG